MSLLKKPIKISVAARMLGVSVSSVYQRKAGTESLPLFRRKNCKLWFTYRQDVEKLLKQSESENETR